ncbi:MAG: diaminopimelate epimerase [Mycoplasmoidaceae bacterium]|nr:MAG: diaminopimelate epimerase [Mycoplasmoidaceae bacterium]
MKYSYSLIYPSGNVTGVVTSKCPKKTYKTINDSILSDHKECEQVCFIKDWKNKTCTFEMAGGEFCGNACRSVGYYCFTKYNTPVLKLLINKIKINCECKKNYSSIKVAKKDLLKKIKKIDEYTSVVILKGITHIVLLEKSKYFVSNPTKEIADNVIKKLQIDDCAIGVMFVDKNTNLKPFVYVKAVDTFYYETACASGSLSCGIVLNKNVSLKQPSGDKLDFKIDKNYISVGGVIKILSEQTSEITQN